VSFLRRCCFFRPVGVCCRCKRRILPLAPCCLAALRRAAPQNAKKPPLRSRPRGRQAACRKPCEGKMKPTPPRTLRPGRLKALPGTFGAYLRALPRYACLCHSTIPPAFGRAGAGPPEVRRAEPSEIIRRSDLRGAAAGLAWQGLPRHPGCGSLHPASRALTLPPQFAIVKRRARRLACALLCSLGLRFALSRSAGAHLRPPESEAKRRMAPVKGLPFDRRSLR